MKPEFLESFSDIREKNIMVIKEAKEKGIPVVGRYCTYCPSEVVLAAGAIAVGLCGTNEKPIAAAEEELPRNLCPLIKSSYGFAATDTCPYFHFSDLVIGETTCDGKKKMFEIMSKLKKVHVMQLPQNTDEVSLQLWYEEVKRLKAMLEAELNVEITDEKLREAIHLVNEGNKALKELFDINKARPAVISGLDMLKVSWQLGFHADRWERIAMLKKLVADYKEMAAQGHYFGNEQTPRILLTGTPVGLGNEKVITLVEECGGVVIAAENCSGYKTVGLQIDENDSRDPLLLLAEKYIQIPCSVMSPNEKRIELLEEMIEEFQVDGVIDLTWQACHTYNIESFFVADVVKNKLQMPFLQLETDYSQSDIETLRVRIQAFLEMI